MSLSVVRPGMLSTFQDLGRQGWQHLGVPVAGAMDARAHRLANLLAGNLDDTATLEVTLTGPTLRFDSACCVALSGAGFSLTRNDQPAALNRPLVMRAGDVLAFGARVHGARAYLAVHGGFALEPQMGSTSTYLRGRLGGWQGRALQRGDRIGLRRPLDAAALEPLARALWGLHVYLPGAIAQAARRSVRIVRSEQWPDFSAESCAALITEPFRISPDSERMGYRLQGPALALAQPRQMISEATTFGTIQVPVGGQPIVLMADRQTTGGYPKIAYVASVDLPLLAQMAPGDIVRFELVSLEQAQQLDAEREAALALLAAQLAPLRQALMQHPTPQERRP